MEVKEFTRFKETPISKGFDSWAPIGTTVRIKVGRFAGYSGVILHQTTRHRYFMMIHLPSIDMDILCKRGDLQ